MRDWTGGPWQGAEDKRVREFCGRVDWFLRDLSAGMGRIQKGEVPDGSGSPIPGGGPAIPNDVGAVLFVGTGPVLDTDGDNLFWDDTNNLLGIGTSSPDAFLTVAQSSVSSGAVEQFAIGAVGGSWTTTGGTFASVWSDSDDATYNAVAAGLIGGSHGIDFTPTTPPAARTGLELRMRVKRILGTGGALNLDFQFSLSGGGNFTKTITSFENYSTTDFTDVALSVSESEFTGNVDIITMTGNFNLRHGIQISRLAWVAVIPTATNLTRWYSGGSLISQVDYAGRFGIGTGSDLLTRMATVEADATTRVGLAVQGFSGQTAALTEWVNSSATRLANVTSDGYFSTRQLLLNGSTSGTLTHIPGATTTSHSLTWPSAQGAAGTVLANNGSGTLSWALTSALTPADFVDSAFRIIGSAGPTKKLAFEVDGFTGAPVTRTLTPQDASYIIAGTNIANTFSAAQAFAPSSDVLPLSIDGTNVSTPSLLEIYDGLNTVLTVDNQAAVVPGNLNVVGMTLYNAVIGSAGSGTFVTSSLSSARNFTLPNQSGTVVIRTAGATVAGQIPFYSGTGGNLTVDTGLSFNTTGDILTASNIAATTHVGNVTFADAINIITNATTGTQIATATTQKLGFWGKAPIVRPAAYTPTNVTTDRAYDANATTTDELADVLGTLIADLQSAGLIG